MRSINGSLDRKPSLTILSSTEDGAATIEALVAASQANILNADIDLVVSNREESAPFDTAKSLSDRYGVEIRTEHISQYTHERGETADPAEQTDSESAAILEAAEEVSFGKVSIILLAGYLRKVRGPLLDRCGSTWPHEPIRVSNLYNNHLGPLPSTAGCYGDEIFRRVAENGKGTSAQVLHGVTTGYNKGPVFKTNYFEVPAARQDASDEEKNRVAKQIRRITLAQNAIFLPRDLNTLIAVRKEYLKEIL